MHGNLTEKGALLHRESMISRAGLAQCGSWHEPGEIDMAKGEQRSNREAKKPKKEKIKVIAAAPSQKTGGWQPTQNTGKKK
jgi:hypothetical protein